MKAEEISVIDFFQQPKQIIVYNPLCNYHWEEIECQQIWDKVIQIGQHTSVPNSFIGTIIYTEYGTPKESCVPRLILIDGQQRLGYGFFTNYCCFKSFI
jgi:uncharacterized protein with ParB-like and HNH nuclease domain